MKTRSDNSIVKNGRSPDVSLETSDFDAPPSGRSPFLPLLKTIRRNIFLVAGVSTVVTMAGMAALKTVAPAPNYESNFQLLVEPVTTEQRIADPLTVTRSDGQVPNQDAFGLDYPTQIAILTNPERLSKIVDRIRTKYPDFDGSALATTLVVKRGVDPNTTTATKTISVSYQGDNPAFVKFVLDQTSEEYLRYSLQDRKTRIGAGVQFITDRLPRVQERVTNLQQQLQDLQQRFGLIDPSQQGQQLSTQVGAVTDLQLETQRQLREQQSLYANLQKQLNLSPNEAIAASALSENPSYRELQTRLQEIESQLAIARATYSESSPPVSALREKEANLVALLNQEAQRIVGQSSGSDSRVRTFQNSVRIDLIGKLVEASNQIQMLQARTQEIAQARSLFQDRLQQFPAVARRYSDLQRQLDIATRTLDQLQTQQDTLSIQAAQSVVPWELVAPPSDPKLIPSKSSKLLILVLGLGLGSGVAAALLLEKSRKTFYDAEEIQEAVQLPVLGVIPFSPDAQQTSGLSALSVSSAGWNDSKFSPSLFQEAFSSLYASLRFLSSNPPIGSFVVCSAGSGDGKTTIALNLAMTVAMMGKSVLLVDADLRSPQLDRSLDFRNRKGLSDILSHGIDPDELIGKSSVSEHLSVLPAGQPTLEAIRLLASNQMQALMEKFQAKFELVIYDTPHLFNLTDASFLAPHTNGILMVVGVGKTNRSMLTQVQNELKNFGLPELGVVINHPRKNTKQTQSFPGSTQETLNEAQFQNARSNLGEV